VDDLNLVLTQRRVFESGLDAKCKLVALALLNHWSGKTETFPSVDRLAVWSSQHRTTVMRCISTLEKLGAIQVKKEWGKSNRYALGQLSLLPVAPCDQSLPATRRPQRPKPVAPSDLTSRPQRPEEIQEEIQEEIHTAARAIGSPTEGARRRKRKHQPETALPPDWQPTEAHQAYAAKHGLQFELELDSFRGWAEGRTVVSWNGTFTTRLANQAKWNRERRAGRGKPVVQRAGSVRESDSSWLGPADAPPPKTQGQRPKLTVVGSK